MIRIASTEITKEGIIVGVSTPDSSYLHEILPVAGQSIYCFEPAINLLLQQQLSIVFESSCPVEFSFTTKGNHIQLTAHSYQSDKAFLYWKEIAATSQHTIGTMSGAFKDHVPTTGDTRSSQINLSENLPIALFELYVYRDGRFEFGYVNNQIYKLFPGFDKDKINLDNQLFLNEINPQDIPNIYHSFDNIWEDNLWEVEFRLRDNNQLKWLKGFGKPQPLVGKEGVKVYAYFRNNSTKKSIEANLELIDFIFRKTSMPIIIGLEDGRFFDVNETALTLYGYTKEEMMALQVDDIRLNKTISYAELWRDVKALNKLHFQSVHKRKDGSIFYVDIVANYLKFGDIEVSSTFITDISQEKLLNEQLGLVDFVFRNSSVPTLIAKADGTFYDFNQAALLLHGYTAQEMATMRVGHLVKGYDEEKWDDAYAEVWDYLKVNKKLEVTVQHKKKDGTIIDVQILANYIKYGDLELNCSYIIDITEKKNADIELKRSNERYAYATIATNDVIWETDLTVNSLYLANSFTTVFGHELNGIEYGENNIWRRNLHPDDYDRVLTKEAEVINGGGAQWQTEYRFRKANGDYAVVLERGFCLRDETGKAIRLFGAIQDITEKKKIEKDLEWSNLRYEYATLVTSDVVWETDLKADTLFLSKNFTLFFGHETPSIMPIQDSIWRKNVHPDDINDVLESEMAIIKGSGDTWGSEYRFRKADGTYAVVVDRSFAMKDEQGNVVKMIGSMQDITLRKQEEERIKLFETVVHNTTQAIIIRDAKKLPSGGFPILYVNESFTTMTGYSLEEIKGKSLKFLIGALTDTSERTKLREAMENGLPGRMEVINYKKNGTPFWASISVFPVVNNKGEITHWVSIQRDVTSRKKAEEEKEHLINELIHNNKELKQFSYITTHNMRAPLTNLLSICKLIDTNQIPDLRTQKLVEGFKQSTALLDETLNDLINILIIKENRNLLTQDISFSDVFNKVHTSISNTIIKAHATIEADFSEADSVNFSKVYLESILLNLLTNSIKYSHKGTPIFIQIKTTKNPDGSVKMVYSDNGIGMDMKRVKDKIFGLYQRFHNNADSKGIGLYLVHSQITALGGTIEVDSEVNVGTTFTIKFRN